LAIGTHGRGVMVLMVPVFSEWMGRRGLGWKRIALGTAVVAATIALPIIVKQTSEITAGSIATNFLMFLPRIGRAFLWLPLALAAAAPFATKSKRWLPMAALVLANWLFFSIVNVPFEDRYLLTAVPAMIILAAQGWRAAAEMLPRYASPVLMIASSAVVIANVIPATRQPDLGYATVVQRLPRL